MFTLFPIGTVHSPLSEGGDDFWGGVESVIELGPELPDESFDGLEEFSHAEILFVCDWIDVLDVTTGARRPCDNPDWPAVGVFAQRRQRRPNLLGSTIVRIVGRTGRTLRVTGLDAIDGTPVVDVKPVLVEFLPHEPVLQPAWSHEAMRNYWRPATERPSGAGA